jgi:hypothetical protein
MTEIRDPGPPLTLREMADNLSKVFALGLNKDGKYSGDAVVRVTVEDQQCATRVINLLHGLAPYSDSVKVLLSRGRVG